MKTIITLLVLILVALMGIAYLLVILKKADSFPEAVTLVLNKFVEGGKFYIPTPVYTLSDANVLDLTNKLNEQYPEYLHDMSPRASWARFSNRFDSAIVCENDSVQSFSTIEAYRAETQRLEVRQRFKEKLKEAITEYQPQNYPPRRHRGWRIMHMFIQIFGLYIQDTSGCKSSLSRYDERYRVVDRDGNIVLDNVSLEYLNGLLDYMYFD